MLQGRKNKCLVLLRYPAIQNLLNIQWEIQYTVQYVIYSELVFLPYWSWRYFRVCRLKACADNDTWGGEASLLLSMNILMWYSAES